MIEKHYLTEKEHDIEFNNDEIMKDIEELLKDSKYSNGTYKVRSTSPMKLYLGYNGSIIKDNKKYYSFILSSKADGFIDIFSKKSKSPTGNNNIPDLNIRKVFGSKFDDKIPSHKEIWRFMILLSMKNPALIKDYLKLTSLDLNSNELELDITIALRLFVDSVYHPTVYFSDALRGNSLLNGLGKLAANTRLSLSAKILNGIYNKDISSVDLFEEDLLNFNNYTGVSFKYTLDFLVFLYLYTKYYSEPFVDYVYSSTLDKTYTSSENNYDLAKFENVSHDRSILGSSIEIRNMSTLDGFKELYKRFHDIIRDKTDFLNDSYPMVNRLEEAKRLYKHKGHKTRISYDFNIRSGRELINYKNQFVYNHGHISSFITGIEDKETFLRRNTTKTVNASGPLSFLSCPIFLHKEGLDKYFQPENDYVTINYDGFSSFWRNNNSPLDLSDINEIEEKRILVNMTLASDPFLEDYNKGNFRERKLRSFHPLFNIKTSCTIGVNDEIIKEDNEYTSRILNLSSYENNDNTTESYNEFLDHNMIHRIIMDEYNNVVYYREKIKYKPSINDIDVENLYDGKEPVGNKMRVDTSDSYLLANPSFLISHMTFMSSIRALTLLMSYTDIFYDRLSDEEKIYYEELNNKYKKGKNNSDEIYRPVYMTDKSDKVYNFEYDFIMDERKDAIYFEGSCFKNTKVLNILLDSNNTNDLNKIIEGIDQSIPNKTFEPDIPRTSLSDITRISEGYGSVSDFRTRTIVRSYVNPILIRPKSGEAWEYTVEKFSFDSEEDITKSVYNKTHDLQPVKRGKYLRVYFGDKIFMYTYHNGSNELKIIKYITNKEPSISTTGDVGLLYPKDVRTVIDDLSNDTHVNVDTKYLSDVASNTPNADQFIKINHGDVLNEYNEIEIISNISDSQLNHNYVYNFEDLVKIGKNKLQFGNKYTDTICYINRPLRLTIDSKITDKSIRDIDRLEDVVLGAVPMTSIKLNKMNIGTDKEFYKVSPWVKFRNVDNPTTINGFNPENDKIPQQTISFNKDSINYEESSKSFYDVYKNIPTKATRYRQNGSNKEWNILYENNGSLFMKGKGMYKFNTLHHDESLTPYGYDHSGEDKRIRLSGTEITRSCLSLFPESLKNKIKELKVDILMNGEIVRHLRFDKSMFIRTDENSILTPYYVEYFPHISLYGYIVFGIDIIKSEDDNKEYIAFWKNKNYTFKDKEYKFDINVYYK